ncbi:type I-C CRISPR-associated protein Cas8c/Csd1 [Chloroflexus sp.]|uniref:type I-C CRISPR-associated protein Cas8c/Csd1 n=1 Tax=Chloroflexus sp. TaxID=1904827 RepID=UPI002603F421|nr:type I-C CRISPR-associated protein Cas8c/Csd1 [uncultured Chloroflexus sp.]
MILQALYNYYQILCDDPDTDIAELGYSKVPVSHALNLSSQGELLEIIPLYIPVQQGKKTVERPRRMKVPEQVKRSVNVEANVLCDNAAYILGLTEKETSDLDYALKRFNAFKERNIAFLNSVGNRTAQAIIRFLESYDPASAKTKPVISDHLDSLLKGSNLIFYVDGKSALDDPEIKQAWESEVSQQNTSEMQCLITGIKAPIARLHPDIKGVRYAQSKGASLVSFNLDAFKSYRRDQGANAPISRRAAAAYTNALNYLLSSENPHRPILFGDTTVVYWADSAEKRYAGAFYALLNPENRPNQENKEGEVANSKRTRDRGAEGTLRAVAEKIEQGKPIDIHALRGGLDDSTRFYVLGLAPNASRLAVRFFLTEPFGVFAERIMQHYDDLRIEKEHANQPDNLSPYRILAECVSPKVTQREEELKASWSLLGGAFMRSILLGTPYPEGLYVAIINRIRHDNDEEGQHRKITYARAAYIKAHLLRKYRHQSQNPYKEALTMALNESYAHPAYVLGRLFALLEKAQIEAIGKEVNATIKDRYFTSACASPASVFPVLLRLSQHHIAKAEYGYALDRKIQELLGMLDAKPFPSRLTLDEQGIFVLGYYHQRAAFYAKSSVGEETASTESVQI